MKKDIHPKYQKAKVKCACGNEFEVNATVPEIEVEICANCHPFYTGQEKFVDTAGRLERFKERLQKSQKLKTAPTKKQKASKKKNNPNNKQQKIIRK